MAAKKMTEAQDKRSDKAAKLKEESKRDKAVDKRRGMK